MESIDLALEGLRPLVAQVGAFLPKLLLAALIALAGWLLAKALRYAVIKALRSVNFHVLTGNAGVDTFLQMGGSRADTTAIIGLLAYWLAIVAALILACNSLGLTYVTELLAKIALFLPHVILALVILVFGAYFAHVIDATLTAYSRNLGMDEAVLLGRLGRYVVLLFVFLMALEQLGIGGEIIRQSFLIILAGVVLALALAFGLGGRQWAAGLLEQWWPREKDRPSQDGG